MVILCLLRNNSTVKYPTYCPGTQNHFLGPFTLNTSKSALMAKRKVSTPKKVSMYLLV